MSNTKPNPFLKFAGGKRAILPVLVDNLPSKFERYYEPFVGGGALFFALSGNKDIKFHISDVNEELINCYKVIRDNLDSLIYMLGMMPYDRDGDVELNRKYYETLRACDRSPYFFDKGEVFRAARMIYLNKTCYNGLYRVNSKGYFNTPFGKRKNPKILDAENLKLCSESLKDTHIFCADFEILLKKANERDFLYFDPPYIPLSDTANFTSYSSAGFSIKDHERLAEYCAELDRTGAKFLLTNSNTDLTRHLYRSFHIQEIPAPRSINREKSSDLVVRNYDL